MEMELKTRAFAKGKDAPESVVGGSTNAAAKTEVDKPTASGTGTGTGTSTEVEAATDEELDKYCTGIAEEIQKKLKLPEEAKELVAKKKLKKLKCNMTIGLDPTGNVKKLEITKAADMDSVNGALQRAINSCSPFKDMPVIKDDLLMMLVKFDGTDVKIERP
jgi:hypothetical protein